MTIQNEIVLENEIQNEPTFVCANCSNEFLFENEMHANLSYCDYCVESNFFNCEICDELINNESMFEVFVTNENRTMQLCRNDYRSRISSCNYCDHRFLIGSQNGDHDQLECARISNLSRIERMMSDNENVLIKDYGYKPLPQFKTTNRKQNAENYLFNNDKTFFGFELETVTENRRDILPVAQLVQDSLKKNVYLKNDGSLNGQGFEIVSEPMSFNYLQQELSYEFLNILKQNNFMSWDAKKIGVSCGIHVHVSKAGFNGNSHIYKFTQLILENKNEWVKMAGRNSKQWSSYDKNLTPILDVLHKKSYQPRYVAVNLSNEHTIEVRLFRGSLNETRFKSAIELVAGAVEYTRNISLTSIKNGGLNFDSFINYLNVYSDVYPNAIEIAKQKGLVK
jgi:DNA-directed RNA polymerase subunit RPC12/RpoP